MFELFILSTPFESWLSFYIGTLRFQLYKITTILALLYFVGELGFGRVKLRKVPLIAPILAYIVMGFISLSVSPTPGASLRMIFAEIFVMILMYSLVVEYCSSDIIIRQGMVAFAWAALLVGSVNCLVVLLYSCGLGSDFLTEYRFVDWIYGRAMWPFTEPVVMGTYCVGAALFLFGTMEHIPDKRYVPLWMISLLLVFFSLILTSGRAAYLGFLVGSFILLWRLKGEGKLKVFGRRAVKTMLMVLPVVLIFPLLAPDAANKMIANIVIRMAQTAAIADTDDYIGEPNTGGISAKSNLYNAIETVPLILERPILGNGVGSRTIAHLGSFALDMGVEEEEIRGGSSNVLPLMILYDRGIIGFIIFLWFVREFFKLKKDADLRAKPGSWAYANLRGIPIALLGVLTTCIFFGNHPYLPSTWVLLGLFSASAVILLRRAV